MFFLLLCTRFADGLYKWFRGCEGRLKGRLEVKQHYIEAYNSCLLTSGRRLEDDDGKKPDHIIRLDL